MIGRISWSNDDRTEMYTSLLPIHHHVLGPCVIFVFENLALFFFCTILRTAVLIA